MPNNSVCFVVRNGRYPYVFDRTKIRLGSIIHVRFDGSGKPQEFLSLPYVDTTPHCVTWISPHEWSVSLETIQDRCSKLINSLRHLDGKYVESSLLKNAIFKAANDLRLEHIFETSELANTPINVVETVLHRLDLCDRLQRDAVNDALFVHHLALATYLLLTCFDRLGQPDKWLSFEEWLRSKQVADERDSAIKQAESRVDFIPKVCALVDRYNEIYGVRRSFYRFIEEVLPAEQRQTLLSSIDINIIDNPPDMGPNRAATEKQKKMYLFQLRNDYTHKSVARVWAEPIPEFPYRENTWFQQEQIFEAKHWKSVATYNWPNVLKETVISGLDSFLRTLAK